MINRFSSEVHRFLIKSGWYSQRSVITKVKLPEEFDFHASALKILNEFGNLDIGDKKKRKGLVVARNTIQLQPSLVCGEEERFHFFSERLNVKLCPLGELDEGLFFLAADESSNIYMLEQDIFFVGKDFDHALETLLKRGRIYDGTDGGKLN